MATFTEQQEYKVEIIPPYNTLQVRRADIVLKDGVEVARSYHRHVCNPGDDVSAEPAVVQQTAGAVWTPDVVAAYEASIPELEPEPEPEFVPVIETEPEVEVTPEPDELQPEPEPEPESEPEPQPEPNEEESN